MRSKTISDLIHKTGLEFGLKDAEMKEVIESQFKFLRNTIAEGSHDDSKYKHFRLVNIGLFYVSLARRKWEQKFYKGKDYEEDNNTGGSEQLP